MTNIALTPKQFDIVKAILHAVPEVWVFGSRVTGKYRKTSDLDICVRWVNGPRPGKLELLKEAFEQSDLPFIVDVCDYHAVAPDFQDVILTTGVSLR